MDLFDKIEQFEKLANEIIDQDEVDDMQADETIEDYLNKHLERQAAARSRMKKFSGLLRGKR